MSSSLAKTYAFYSSDWVTPEPWWDWVYSTFGTDEVFDPCPTEWQPGEPSGLDIPWETGSYVNHPGSRGSAQRWWLKYQAERQRLDHMLRFIWCAFNIEQLRHLDPTPLGQPGFLVMPRNRTPFIWGGPNIAEKVNSEGKVTASARIHGAPMKQPGNWSVWWSTEKPAKPPVESIIILTSPDLVIPTD